MDVYLDDRKTDFSAAPDAPLGTLLAEMKARLEGDRLIVGIQCDGLDVTGQGFSDALSAPLTSFARIDMQSADPRALVSEALQTSTDLLDATEKATGEVVESLTQGKTQAALPKLGECCQAWLHVHEGVCNAVGMLGLDAAALTVEGQPLVELLRGPVEQLRQLKEAVESRDYVLLADVLTYEFTEAVSTWRKIIAALTPATTVASA